MLKNILIAISIISLILLVAFRNQIHFVIAPIIYYPQNIYTSDAISYFKDEPSKVHLFSPDFSFVLIHSDASTTKLTDIKDKNTFILMNWADCEESVFDDVDIETFKLMTKRYARDKENIYYYNCTTVEKLTQVDYDTFQTIGTYDGFRDFAKDKNSVYYNGKVIPNADPKTFKVTTVTDTIFQDQNKFYSEDELKNIK